MSLSVVSRLFLHSSVEVICSAVVEVNLLMAIRGGGHNVGGRALCDEGLVVDLTEMRGVSMPLAQHSAFTVADNLHDKFIGEGISGSQFFPGQIDEVRLSNSVRSMRWRMYVLRGPPIKGEQQG